MALNLSKVLISDSVDVSCREILQSSGIQVDYKPGIAKEDLLSIIKVLKLDMYDRGGLLAELSPKLGDREVLIPPQGSIFPARNTALSRQGSI